MGEKLVRCYEIVAEKGGLQSKMRLAMKTGVPSNNALKEPDSPENLAKFRAAAKEILGTDISF